MKRLLVLLLILGTLLTLSCQESSSEIEPEHFLYTGSLSRSDVILTADKYVRLKWNMTSENYSAAGCDQNSSFRSQYYTGERIGVGYKWSGWTNVDTFLEKINQGYGTGTGGYFNYSNISFECIVGVSCTGFVSRAWQLSEKYTLNYPYETSQPQFRTITHNIDWNEIEKGDAFINEAHIILFVYETKNGYFKIMDSTGPGVAFRTITREWLKYNNYQPIRYNEIMNPDEENGCITNPEKIELSGNGKTIFGNTRKVVSMEFDKYNSAESINNSGPEHIYSFNLTEAKNIKISVSDFISEGINNNIYLLSSLDFPASNTSGSCLAWGDNNISIQLDAGNYFLIVDSVNNQPGEYTLTLTY